MNDHWFFIGAGYGITWIALGWYLLRLRGREREAAAASGRGGEGAGTGSRG